jgi:primosomal protein N' (replication factor Y)
MRIARVIMNLSLDRAFDYLIPGELRGQVRAGMQVMVPFGRSRRQGYVVGLAEESEYPAAKLKPILEICGRHPQIPDTLLKLGEWLADYYCCSREQAVRTLLPGSVRSGKIRHRTVRHYHLTAAESAQEFIFAKGARAPAKTAILRLLLQHPGMSGPDLLREAKAKEGPLRDLVKAGLVGIEDRESRRDPFAGMAVVPSTPLTLTDEQAAAMRLFAEMLADPSQGHTLLLHGVTGSGKTEVYLQAIAQVLGHGREAIVLVPEIALTPQTVERFRARFGERVSVLHSGLGDGERHDEWIRIHRGEVRIAVGARSALFAPFRNLGLIVVDEEHENSYKQDEAPRYHARDVAVMRGLREQAIVILGSATPALESWRNATIGKYRLARLTRRIDDCLMPRMEVVDMRAEAEACGGTQIFSRDLVAAVYARLERGEQTILFLNRRGYATQMLCQHCGFVARCPDCAVSYTFHRQRAALSCHLCGALLPAPAACPDCGAADIRYSGLGTEKVETIARKLFPGAAIRRMDSDTMTARHCYDEVLREFRTGRIDILIGTQMIAKGLHFPNVTLVGIVYADLGLHLPDFRATERTFQLLVQVAGRAGRGEIPGEVIVQTYSPGNPAIRHALGHDVDGFCALELEQREALAYPPCGHLVAIHFRGPDDAAVAAAAADFRARIEPLLPHGVILAGPVPSPVAKIKGKFRHQILLRGGPFQSLRRHLRNLVLHGPRAKDVDTYIDVDAINLM